MREHRFPRMRINHELISDGSILSPDYIKSYLTCHRSALEEFIMESVSVEDLEDWLHAKKSNNNAVTKLDGN